MRETHPQRTILVADDNDGVRELLRHLLEAAGLVVLEAPDGSSALRRLSADRPDLVVLDVAMPVLDGWATLDRIRDVSDVPVLVCSAIQGSEARVRALVAGADDYVVKPFDNRELAARVVALLRRAPAHGSASERQGPEMYDDGGAQVDTCGLRDVVDGVPLELTPLELRLLAAFVRHAGVVLSRQQLLELACEDELGTREQVKVAVAGLRRKLVRDVPDAGGVTSPRVLPLRSRTPSRLATGSTSPPWTA